ncbi:MAG: hypothetical protein VX529_09570 [Pseudomonadota bacterium]|nr:hypothetical protein [Pseudomonadota bacterium]
MSDDLRALATIEAAVAKSTGRFVELRKRADDVYAGVVEQIMEREGCDARTAHRLAKDDPVARRAYALSSELADRHAGATEAASRIAAFVR